MKTQSNINNMDLLCTEQLLNESQYNGSVNNHRSTIASGGSIFNNRSNGYVNKAPKDEIFLRDLCLNNLLKSEERCAVGRSYFDTVQKDITPEMRKIVAEWMMEVCEEEKCQDVVVLIALNYMDRFLGTTLVKKNHLQILASTCLLMASKLREPSCRGLSADILVYYTDNSIVKRDLLNWELFVLSKLKWDLSSVTPLDFLELLLFRLPIANKECPDINTDKVRQHSQAFIWITAKEHCFSIYSPSTIAASSIAATLNGLSWPVRTGVLLQYLLNQLTDLTGITQDHLQECMFKMEKIFAEYSRKIISFSVSAVETHQIVGDNYCNNNSYSISDGKKLQEKCKIQSGTPTDVQDLKF